MGCGGSTGQSDGGSNAAVTETQVEAVTGAWAVRSEAPVLKKAPSGREGDKLTDKTGACVITDADDEEIEIIYEGKKQEVQRNDMANGQEGPPDELETEPSKDTLLKRQQEEAAAAAKAQALSKRQQEEAAKLAEQRKRFDNQRYQQSGATHVSPTNGVSDPTRPPKHEMVMGLNFNQVQQKEESSIVDACGGMDCLPGGIVSPREEEEARVVPKRVPNNQHERFDDDDERLMKEILEAAEI
eukprot:TRINITY_DN56090_c0_g1_i1.p1 TRINITY_DN56090_c0_g1~~TRINITY_DN56090_c0_g1_i1.p1  ORF type:complete len:242 (-),score=76.10 TRINITY_DN56090_c0_g1_i1:158-883(-)